MKIPGKKRIARLLFTGLILCAILLPTAALAGLADGTSWDQFMGDVTHVGYSGSKAPNTNVKAWVSENIGTNGSSSVAVAKGKVFVYAAPSGFDETAPSALYCLDETTGSVIWSTNVPPAEWGSWSSPAYHNGKVFISSGKETWCLDATNGSKIWAFANPSRRASCNGGPVIAGGRVFVSDWDGAHYYCLDENTGYLKWTFNVAGYAQGTPAYADGKVYFTSWVYVGGHVYCVDATTGKQIWHITTELDACGSATVVNGTVYFTTYNFSGDGELYALNALDGSTKWVKIVQRTDSTPAVAYGKVYVCGGCTGYSFAMTHCFNAETGDVVWETSTALGLGNWTASVAIADGKVFVGKPDSSHWFNYAGIYALNAENGSVVWSSDEGGATAAIANGRVYTVGLGRVYAFGPKWSVYKDWDVNQDGSVNVLDMILVGQHFGETGSPGWIRADVNKDGSINVLDMILIGQHFNS